MSKTQYRAKQPFYFFTNILYNLHNKTPSNTYKNIQIKQLDKTNQTNFLVKFAQ